MEVKKQIKFTINNESAVVNLSELTIWRISDYSIGSLRIKESSTNRVLGINYSDSKLETSVLTTSFRKEHESLGVSTVNYLNRNIWNYDCGILYPAGYDFNSIEYILEVCSEMSLLLILNSQTYFELFYDKSFGEASPYSSLARNPIPKFKVRV
jgi:hypothetical protein